MKRICGPELGAADSHGLAETGGKGTTNQLERSHSIVRSGPDAFRCSERERPFKAASGATEFATAAHLADVDLNSDAQYHQRGRSRETLTRGAKKQRQYS
ncbi:MULTISPECIES: hypothetical protein [unclassified Mesorhizobium]|uniref:hypothetical protein n=1 Tax=unclassified Mesorhizobium TaxID=325217 RepID=UPI0019D2EA53|nr:MULTISPECIES: hypothetical protein [unclassified Mesorhizobium]